jgi:hypothetical protein
MLAPVILLLGKHWRYALRECIVKEHPLRQLRKFVPYLEQPERKVMDIPAASGMESDSVSGQFT